jgi:hypothetical protein
MTVPGGSRRGNCRGVLDEDPESTELSDAHEFADPSVNGEDFREGKDGGGPVHRGEESEPDAPCGVWLATGDGTMLFHPVSASTGEGRPRQAPEAASAEEADEMTLDAACRLMPLLPRELIAEYLQLGPYRSGGGAA